MTRLRSADCVVLGAGMVGIATAIHLINRGCLVILVDRKGPALETSFGNAGLIQAEAVMPYAFPRDIKTIASVLLGRSTEARLDWPSLPRTAGWLFRYWRSGSAERVRKTADALFPLVIRALPEHCAILQAAGLSHLLHDGGYLRVFRDPAALDRACRIADTVKETYGIPFTACDPSELARLEPHLSDGLAGAIRHETPRRVSDPGDTGAGYAAHFAVLGGTIAKGDARTLISTDKGWRVETDEGPVAARHAVVALGPWSGACLSAFGTRAPLGVKRGYHMHYTARGNAVLNNLVVDEANGYVITPNRRGLRVTTGAEFATMDAPRTPVQLTQVEPIARDLFPFGDRLEGEPWMGCRPCLPDLLPAIGLVHGSKNLWANFGHHHLGFTLGPASGRLLAELITGEQPFTDPAPYDPARF